MRLISKATGETIAEITTNRNMTIGEALRLMGYELIEDKESWDSPDYRNPETGAEVWEEDIEMIY